MQICTRAEVYGMWIGLRSDQKPSLTSHCRNDWRLIGEPSVLEAGPRVEVTASWPPPNSNWRFAGFLLKKRQTEYQVHILKMIKSSRTYKNKIPFSFTIKIELKFKNKFWMWCPTIYSPKMIFLSPPRFLYIEKNPFKYSLPWWSVISYKM